MVTTRDTPPAKQQHNELPKTQQAIQHPHTNIVFMIGNI